MSSQEQWAQGSTDDGGEEGSSSQAARAKRVHSKGSADDADRYRSRSKTSVNTKVAAKGRAVEKCSPPPATRSEGPDGPPGLGMELATPLLGRLEAEHHVPRSTSRSALDTPLIHTQIHLEAATPEAAIDKLAAALRLMYLEAHISATGDHIIIRHSGGGGGGGGGEAGASPLQNSPTRSPAGHPAGLLGGVAGAMKAQAVKDAAGGAPSSGFGGRAAH